ncbi:MAG TPA: response regulator transcription factor [Thermotogota bacterium]|nr:response regulator transcription factor [Thermotogota bacterium]HRW34674.1 response regulator transcription factor [Thermotogota bacterium]
MKILIVEDEKPLASALSEILTKNHYLADCVYDGEDGLEHALSGIYDVILLDIMLPRMNGFQVLSRLREEKVSTPVIMLTAKAEVDDKVKGLDYGADDYLTKPFETKELLARIRAVTRRKGSIVSDELTFGNLSLDKSNLKITSEQKEIKVSLKEYLILELLIKNAGQVISKEQFIERIWGFDFDGEYNIVEVYISFVRKKLQSIRSNVKIVVIRGLGYTLESAND